MILYGSETSRLNVSSSQLEVQELKDSTLISLGSLKHHKLGGLTAVYFLTIREPRKIKFRA